jgi:hypothetical protein
MFYYFILSRFIVLFHRQIKICILLKTQECIKMLAKNASEQINDLVLFWIYSFIFIKDTERKDICENIKNSAIFVTF